MIEIAALATTLVGSILGPFLKRGAEELGKKLQDQAGDAAASGMVKTAKVLWEKVLGKAAGTGKEPVVDLYAKQPEVMASSMRDAIEEWMRSDPAFHKEISDLVEGDKAGGAERWQLTGETVGVVRVHEVSGGVVAGVMINHGPTAATVPGAPDLPRNRSE